MHEFNVLIFLIYNRLLWLTNVLNCAERDTCKDNPRGDFYIEDLLTETLQEMFSFQTSVVVINKKC